MMDLKRHFTNSFAFQSDFLLLVSMVVFDADYDSWKEMVQCKSMC